MAKITLGGERLGSGKKMEVNIPEFGRSSHDQGFVFTTDQAFGTLVPALNQIGTRGDVAYINDITSLVRTLPTNGPVFGSVKQQIDVFAAPIRLYIGALHNNITGIGLKMNQIKFPVTEHVTTVYESDYQLKNPNSASVARDSLSAYLGSNGSRYEETGKNVQYNEMDIFKLFYWDIYKNYYANKQEEEGVVIKGSKKNNGVLSITASNFIPGKDLVAVEGNIPKWGVPYVDNSKDSTQFVIEFTQAIDESILSELEFAISPGDGTGSTISTIESLIESGNWIKTEYESSKVIILLYVGESKTRDVIDTQPFIIAPESIWGREASVEMERFPLSNIDKMREAILSAPIGVPLVINKVGNGLTPYNTDTIHVTDENGKIREARSVTMCGLGIKCHLSDMFNNWLQTDWIDGENGINELTSIDTSNGSFTVNEFILDYKLFKMMNRIAISDGSYDAWQTAVYGQEGRVITESPIYCGGYSSEVAFDEVVSNAATDQEPLGSLAGRGSQQGRTRKGGKNIKIKCDEAMLIMAISSFTPRVSYSQGQQWWTNLESMDDLHKPDLDGIAFQNLNTGSMAAWTINEQGDSRAVGKQPSWLEYTTEVNHTFGSFSPGESLEHMVINRTYQADETGNVENVTTYIDPTEFNVIFADQKLSAKPFWVQIGFDLTMRRKMSASQIPNL